MAHAQALFCTEKELEATNMAICVALSLISDQQINHPQEGELKKAQEKILVILNGEKE